jgi:glycosyltransferase involved in cell wall biosynthesis
MKKRHIGLVFPENDFWTGGSNYVMNLVRAMNNLPDDKKPIITAYYSGKKELESLKKLNYPFIKFQCFINEYSAFQIFINKVWRLFFYRNLFHNNFVSEEVDCLFPILNHNFFKPSPKNIYWIPDFQEYHLPHFFTARQLKSRKKYQSDVAGKTNKIVFSSVDALSDFRKIFPRSNAVCKVVNFAVLHPDFSGIRIDDLRHKYKLPLVYFFAPNQFWAHKNHKIVLEALKILKGRGVECLVAFSGKESDHRNPLYFGMLKNFVQENGLHDNVRFLGFIDRLELLCLMKNSRAVIQPSLFEGWSTVVEDAKALNAFIIASNLAVHKEQLNENALFFDPLRADELTNHLLSCINEKPTIKELDYHKNVLKFTSDFLAVLE